MVSGRGGSFRSLGNRSEDSLGLLTVLRVGENCTKVGVSKDELGCMKALAQKFVLKEIVLVLLKPSKAQVGNSRDYFDDTVFFAYNCQRVQATRNLYRLETDIDTSAPKNEGVKWSSRWASPTGPSR